MSTPRNLESFLADLPASPEDLRLSPYLTDGRLKRLLNLAVAGTAGNVAMALGALPAGLAIAAANRVNPIFIQERSGTSGSPLSVVKLRTLKDSDRTQHLRFGKQARRWAIDELPQFAQIITGRLQLVALRPALVEDEDFSNTRFENLLRDKLITHQAPIHPDLWISARRSSPKGLLGPRPTNDTPEGFFSLVCQELDFVQHDSFGMDIGYLKDIPGLMAHGHAPVLARAPLEAEASGISVSIAV